MKPIFRGTKFGPSSSFSNFSIFTFLLVSAGLPLGCSSGFSLQKESRVLKVTLDKNTNTGTALSRLKMELKAEKSVHVLVEALDDKGIIDSNFSKYVNLEMTSARLVRLLNPDGGVDKENIQLKSGRAEVDVFYTLAYGDVRVVARDLGYSPGVKDPKDDSTTPACSDGKDDDADGFIDFPLDVGCAAADDDSEEGGSFSSGSSAILYYDFPRISDLRGVIQNGTSTPFKTQTVDVNTGYDPNQPQSATNLVVTTVLASGFYVTDKSDPRGYTSLYVLNTNVPRDASICDNVAVLSGTAAEPGGTVQLVDSTWSLQKWSSRKDRTAGANCPMPEASLLSEAELGRQESGLLSDKGKLINLMYSLAKVEAGTFTIKNVDHSMTLHVGSKLGASHPHKDNTGAYLLSDDATNCDFNSNGKIDSGNSDEKACDTLCSKDVECTEYTYFSSRSNFKLVLEDSFSGTKKILTLQANSSAYPRFNATDMRGKRVAAIRGAIGPNTSQFILQIRCADDVAEENTKLVPTSLACVPK